MGNNAAFSTWESTVIACYNKGVLDKELLTILMEQGRDVDIDRGGMAGTLSKMDELDCQEITIKVFGGTIPPKPNIPKDHRKWTEEQSKANADYWEQKDAEFAKITRKFGW